MVFKYLFQQTVVNFRKWTQLHFPRKIVLSLPEIFVTAKVYTHILCMPTSSHDHALHTHAVDAQALHAHDMHLHAVRTHSK